MEITITKTGTKMGKSPVKKSPLDSALEQLDEVIDRNMLGSYGSKVADEDEKLASELEKVPSEGEVSETLETGHEEPDGDEIPDDLKQRILEALMSE